MSKPLAVIDIVNDDLNVLMSLGRAVCAYGYRVCMFNSGKQYLETVEEGKASCVVVGIGLGGTTISGLELGRAIALSRRAIPIVFVSSAPHPAIREEAMAIGAVAYLREPVSSEELIAAIRRCTA